MHGQSQASFSRNRLLSALPEQEFEELRPKLRRVDLAVRQVLEEPNEPIRHVYFPDPSVSSVIAITPQNERLEVGLFGSEGMSGLAVLNGTDRSPHQTFIQVPGQAIRIEADELRTALDTSPSLRRLLLLYSQAQTVQISYTALANGRFTIDERLARWLLMCHDRIDGEAFPITHEFLAIMLGIRRAGVTTALQALETSGVIKAGRGRIEILDREELRAGAGDCYGAPEAEYERLIGSFKASQA
jgi:CRP-like cAMP-binding protein